MALLKSIKALLRVIIAVLLGCATGWLLKLGAHSTYLELQAVSDAVHRFTLVALPLVIVFAIMSGVLAHRLRNRFRGMLVGLCVVCLVLGSGMLTYTLSFDASLEAYGLAGQFELGQDASVSARETSDVLGPFSEEPEGQHPIRQVLPNGDVLTLDRQILARRAHDGSFQWHLPRPARRPGSLLVLGDTLLLIGGGAYEDDTLLQVIALESGRLRWSYHCLGNRVFPPAVEGTELAFTAWRPATSSVVLIRWHEPRLVWAVRFDTPLVLPPRFTAQGLEVATGDEVLLLSRSSGQVLKRQPACGQAAAIGVACQAGRVVAWIDKETP